ncbi:MAG: hypothetical protein H6825_07960 [Planctomycetes bacterium]|nr:hypothetical protein [Planctomycetota bacterium]
MSSVDDPGPPPVPPQRDECCGRACDPCIWTYHHRAMQRWKERVALWQASRGHDPFAPRT